MKYFKTKALRTEQRFRITEENFEKQTHHKYPYEQVNSSQTITQYGVCPSCLNPIQLIGLSKQTKVRPYGKHTGKSIKGIGRWNQIKYEYCPYSVQGQRREINDEERFDEITDDILQLYNILKNQFDRVVYVISNTLHIQCSANFWKKVLSQFIINQGYCYPWLTEVNLPYIFAFIGMRHHNIYGQCFEKNSNLLHSLECQNIADFLPVDDKNKYMRIINKEKFFNYEFSFSAHHQSAVRGKELIETMNFCVDDTDNQRTIYEETINFSETYFYNIINKTKNQSKRNKKLLDIANEVMPDLQINV